MEIATDIYDPDYDGESKYELLGGVQYGKIDYEIIGGEKIYMAAAAPNIPHNLIIARLIVTFTNCIDENNINAVVIGDNADVYLSDDEHIKPDVSVVCNLNINDNFKRLYRAPDLVVEVLSESTKINDRVKKKATYEKFGVKEYWIVDPEDRSIQVYHNIEDKFNLSGEYKLHSDNNEIKVSIFDDLIVDLHKVFKWWLN